MRGTFLGILASLLSAAAAMSIARTENGGVNPLWLLLIQYLVGVTLAPPRRWPVAPLGLHALRLAAGLWAFGGYYLALASRNARPSEISMLLNTAPVFTTFIATRNRRARLGALLAFTGVAAELWNRVAHATISGPYILALTAAGAYTASFLLLGNLATAGEAPSTTNSVYNAAASLLVLLMLVAARPVAPTSWFAVAAIGMIAALRIQVLTIAAVNPREAARVSVLSNLAFVWMAIWEAIEGSRQYSGWSPLLLVLAGTWLANTNSSKLVHIVRQSFRRLM